MRKGERIKLKIQRTQMIDDDKARQTEIIGREEKTVAQVKGGSAEENCYWRTMAKF